MERDSTKVLSFLLLVAILTLLKACNGTRILLVQDPASMQFIRTSCRSTTYPALCLSSLSSRASTIQTSPMLLAHTALSVTLESALSSSIAMKTMSKSKGMSPRVAEAMADCLDAMGESVDEFKQSMEAMGNLGGKDLGFQHRNFG